MSTATAQPQRKENLGPLMRLLVLIENAGNKLPHPFWLFLSLALIVMVISSLCAAAGLSAVNPATNEAVNAVNLFSMESLRTIVSGVVTNYMEFPALGLVLIVLFGVAVAERSGLIPGLMRAALQNVSPKWVTAVVALVGTASSIASDAAYMVVIPLGGIAFKAVGRNPVIGCAVAYASVAGGYSAAPFVNSLDAILGGISTSAAHIVDGEYTVTPVANLYFNFISMFVVSAAIVLVTELLLNKRGEQLELDPAGDDEAQEDEEHAKLTAKLTPLEKRGMVIAAITIVLCFAIVFVLCLPANSFLRDEEGGFGPKSGLMAGIAAIIGFGFFIVGIVYGVVVKEIRSPNDIPEMIIKGLVPFVPVMLLFFAASQFLALFKMSNLGQILAIVGADFFKGANTPPFVILLGALLITSLGALLITSGSGLWTLMAPVLVPMLMLLGIAPELTQAVYRIGDSVTNIISPMSPYFVMILGFIQRYKRDAGIGTLLSLTIPLSVVMWVFWAILFFGWWLTGIPMGPGAHATYTVGG
ncbi:p-aminobenzoyl-glutamate transporter [Brevibacterium sp. 5221]|uniref:p-aminobenzoyl-glutamate transporter n=1 Tax=Brevibacterium rongguiense TaxID=2695267 RepID=A0A6N9H9B4_9MICO|nr:MULTISPECIES: AbgT family transporter [Brevibacterium]MYM20638.1 p-aminobenzoyl-glutamate transporter [Brevibacterium rongguiense]WAL40301.1 AbgT family transporter [Brevibacterium sp. BRM-1]